MNYLAHIYLADLTGTSQVGNFLGDFVKGRLEHCGLPLELRHGIFIHRKVDVFTDEHPVVKRSRSRISAQRRRYAGIIVDLAFDHFLAKYWTEFASQPLALFVEDFYDSLQSQMMSLPESGQKIVPHLIDGNWLLNYQTYHGVAFALDGIGRRYKNRFNRENPLLDSVAEIQLNEDSLLIDFREFFPQLIDFCLSVIVDRGFPSDFP